MSSNFSCRDNADLVRARAGEKVTGSANQISVVRFESD